MRIFGQHDGILKKRSGLNVGMFCDGMPILIIKYPAALVFALIYDFKNDRLDVNVDIFLYSL